MRRRWSLRLYEAALRAYPPATRVRYGPELTAAFEESWRARRERGRRAAAGYTVRATIDVVREGLRDRARRRAGVSSPPLADRLRSVLADLAFGGRVLANAPGFAAAAMLTLALGIGANSAIFSVVEAVVLRPLPFPEPHRIVTVWDSRPDRGIDTYGVSPWDFGDWEERQQVFESLAMYLVRAATLTGGEEAARVQVAEVTAPFLAVMRVEPLAGRGFAADEGTGSAVALVGAGIANRLFGTVEAALAEDIVVDGRPLTIVGVMPPDFVFPGQADVWRPFEVPATENGPRDSYFVRAVARLLPGVEVDQAKADIDGIMLALQEEYPDSNAEIRGHVEPLIDTVLGDTRAQLGYVQAIAVMVLLIAGVNVSSLLLTRGTARGGELAVRAALGASSGRLMRQMVAESTVLSLLGGALGVALAHLTLPAIVRLGVEAVPRLESVALNGTVLGASLLLSLVAGVGFGILPAWRVARGNTAEIMRTGARSVIQSDGARLRRVFVIAQLALALVVLVGAGLLLRSLANVTRIDPGFDTGGLLVARVEPPWRTSMEGMDFEGFVAAITAERAEAGQFFDELRERVAGLPGVQAVGLSNVRPFAPVGMWNSSFEAETAPLPRQDRPVGFVRVVTPGYLETLGVPLLAGRLLQPSDDAAAGRVVVLSATAATRLFGAAPPLGERITTEGSDNPEAAWAEVVGVVGDVPSIDLERPDNAMIYVPFAQGRFGHFGDWGMDLVVRTGGAPAAVAGSVRDIVRRLDPALPLFRLETVEEAAADRLSGRRFNVTLLSLFAGLALVLTVIGLYGVMAFSVAQRVPEIGVRLALGARPAAITRLIVGDGLRLVLCGTVLGALAALVWAGSMEGLLFGVEPRDTRTLAEVAAVLGAAGLLACLLPAWRSARLDPTRALRDE